MRWTPLPRVANPASIDQVRTRGATDDCGWSCRSGIFPDVPELTHLKGIGILENSFLPQDIRAHLWGLPRGLTAIWL